MKALTVRAALALLFVASPAFADDEAPSEDDPDRRPDHGVAIGLGFYSFQPFLGQTTFKGSGIPTTGGPVTAFAHTGRDFGLNRPGIFTTELRLSYLTRHFEIGGHLLYGGHFGAADHSADPAAAAIADGGSVAAAGGGLHAAVVFPLAKTITLQLGVDVGARAYAVDLVGDQEKICRGRYGAAHPCFETATAVDVYFQPRIAFGWNSAANKPTPTYGFELTVWGGPDIANGLGVAFGIGAAFAPPHASLK